MEDLRLALDWTPNTNHTGFFAAQAKGWYREQGIRLTLLNPAKDQYISTPAKKVELGQADLALCPMESVISYRTKRRPFDLVAVAALLREDISAIACLAGRGIGSPRDLDGKVYASYQARYEDGMVRQMVRNDGGAGDLRIEYPAKLGIWQTLITGQADATWIFQNWEGFQAQAAGLDLVLFPPRDYGIPYAYSPVIAGSAQVLAERREVIRRFLAATRAGFLEAKRQPAEGAACLRPHLPAGDYALDLEASQRYMAPFYGDENTWGRIDRDAIAEFLQWLADSRLETNALAPDTLLQMDYLD